MTRVECPFNSATDVSAPNGLTAYFLGPFLVSGNPTPVTLPPPDPQFLAMLFLPCFHFDLYCLKPVDRFSRPIRSEYCPRASERMGATQGSKTRAYAGTESSVQDEFARVPPAGHFVSSRGGPDFPRPLGRPRRSEVVVSSMCFKPLDHDGIESFDLSVFVEETSCRVCGRSTKKHRNLAAHPAQCPFKC